MGWFVEITRMIDDNGMLGHGEMRVGEDIIMLATPTPEYQGPRLHRDNCEAARSWSEVPWVIDGVLVYVKDLDRHYDRSKAAGAHILLEPDEGPDGRRYRAEDLEGHRWMLVQRS